MKFRFQHFYLSHATQGVVGIGSGHRWVGVVIGRHVFAVCGFPMRERAG